MKRKGKSPNRKQKNNIGNRPEVGKTSQVISRKEKRENQREEKTDEVDLGC